MEKGRRGWKDHSSSRATLFIDFLTKRSEPFTLFAPPGQLQWRIQGRGPGGHYVVHYVYPVRLPGLV